MISRFLASLAWVAVWGAASVIVIALVVMALILGGTAG